MNLSKYNDGELVIVEISDLSKLSQIGNDYDICLVNKWVAGITKYPTKLTYEINLTDSFSKYLTSLNRKKRYNLLRLYKIVGEKISHRIIEDFSKDQFKLWLKGYDSFIGTLPYGDNRVNEEWYNEGKYSHFLIEYTDTLTGEVVGGTLVKKLKEKLSMSYGWSDFEIRRLGLATYELYILLEYAISQRYPKVSFGQDSNLYGGHLSLGLHHFKTYWNAIPKFNKQIDIKGIIINPLTKKIFNYYALDEENNLVLIKVNNEDK